MYYVYIIKSVHNNTTYTGMTTGLKRRLVEHNSGKVKHTKQNSLWELIWYSAFVTKEKASSFEKYLKTGSGIAFRNKRLF